jgi:hypothetical protein
VRKGLTVSPEITLELNEGIKLAFASTVSTGSVKIEGVLIAASAESFYKIQVEGETSTFTLGGNGKVNIAGAEASPAAVTVQVEIVAVDDDDDLSNSGNNDDIFWDNEGDGQYDGGISAGKITAKDFIFDFDGLSSTDTASLAKDKPAGVLFLPVKDGPWTASLIENWGDNASFKLENSEGPIESALIADPDAYSAVKVMIAAEGGLSWGIYEAGVKITNGTTEINKKLTISVLETPSAPKTAPLVYPYITGVGKNKLGVIWKGTLPSGANGVKLYINTENNSGNAFLYESYSVGSDKYTAAKADITDFANDSYDKYLPDGTTYYVWTRAYSNSGDGLFSPVRSVTTSCTIPEMFYKDINEKAPDGSNNFFAWDSFYGNNTGTGDMYIIHPPGSNDRIYPGGLLHYGQMHPSTGKSSGFRGDIVYFNIIKGYSGGKGKWGESLAGGIGGVFIIRYHDTYAMGLGNGVMYNWVNTRRYMAVFFYGMGVIQTVGPPVNTLGPDGAPLGKEMGYFGNAYNLGGCNPEVDTFEQAFESFKSPMGYIAYIATPWYHNFKPEASGKDPADYVIGKYDEQDYYYNEDGNPAIDWSTVDIAKPGYEDLTKVKF